MPPGGARSWRAWAASGPDAASRRAALDLLVRVAATGARATSYSPYLGADLPGTGRTRFSYAFAPGSHRSSGDQDLVEPGGGKAWGSTALCPPPRAPRLHRLLAPG